RRLSRAGDYPGGDGLGADHRALRGARPARAVPRRGVEPRGGDRDGFRPAGGPRARRRAGLGAVAPGLPPPAHPARPPPPPRPPPGVRGDRPAKRARFDEARPEFERAASLTRNARERELLLGRARACADGPTPPESR